MNAENIIPQISETFQPGAIVYDCYGYEQTNIDFYFIVKKINNHEKFICKANSTS